MHRGRFPAQPACRSREKTTLFSREIETASGLAAERAARPLSANKLMYPHVPDQTPVDVHARIEHQAVLRLLQLVQKKHDQDAADERRESRVEGDTEAERDPGNVAVQRAL